MLNIQNLHVTTEGKDILKGINLLIKPGEVHAIMGPNGAGKTTLAMSLMGNPNYQFKMQNAKFKINDKNMFKLTPEERARAGLFVSFQHPVSVIGVSVLAFLRTAYKALHPQKPIKLSEFKETVKKSLLQVGLPEDFMQRSINEGFSGGEKKRMEIVQLLVLKPRYAILDEIDSGLDIDSLRIIAKAVAKIVKKQKMGILLITHYQRILHYLKPDFVHVLKEGKIAASDGMALVTKIERKGYATI
ncbi:MAG: Fe-S cluster assembly ATPase SufC [Candidatus Levybacteria bacterium]|nr:Fe-S cluster assembly ATPase SufC [Candidatus Levybacteria bacterium]